VIEVVAVGARWTYRLLAPCGRVLVRVEDTWADDLAAFAAGLAYRTTFWRVAAEVERFPGSF
jgi:hypothetical protein